MVLNMEVSIPQKLAHEPVGLYCTSVLEAVHLLANLAVGMLEIAYVVDGWVANHDGDEPPKGEGGQAFLSLAEDGKYERIDEELLPGGSLEGLHQTRSRRVGLGLHTPTPAGVVHRDAPGRVDDAEDSAGPGRPDVEELLEVGITSKGDIAEAGGFEFLPAEVGGELRVLVDIVGESVVLIYVNRCRYVSLCRKYGISISFEKKKVYRLQCPMPNKYYALPTNT